MAFVQLPSEIVAMMAVRMERMHHYLWHEVRNGWLSYDTSTQQEIATMGWQPPRPARDANGNVLFDNGSGEDFLYMHHDMIQRVNMVLAQLAHPDYPQVVGWSSIPAPNDTDYPVPPAWDDPNDPTLLPFLQKVKSDNYYQSKLLPWARQYSDTTFLKTVSLGRLGALLEFTIHNNMHMRWAARPDRDRPNADPTNPAQTISTDWDVPQYNYLGDTYSSHVNSIFWKLHGWVDARIEDWKRANNVTGDNFWRNKWVGNMQMDGMSGMAGVGHMFMHRMMRKEANLDSSTAVIELNQHLQQLEQMSKLIAQTGVMHTPFRLTDEQQALVDEAVKR